MNEIGFKSLVERWSRSIAEVSASSPRTMFIFDGSSEMTSKERAIAQIELKKRYPDLTILVGVGSWERVAP